MAAASLFLSILLALSSTGAAAQTPAATSTQPPAAGAPARTRPPVPVDEELSLIHI